MVDRGRFEGQPVLHKVIHSVVVVAAAAIESRESFVDGLEEVRDE